MRYAWARYNDSRRELAYRIYISDCLRILTENTAKQLSLTPQPEGADVRGAYVSAPFYAPTKPQLEDTQPDGDEIVDEILRMLGVI